MKDIISEAQKNRYIVEEGASVDKGIALSDAWMVELQKHPYHSSKYFQQTFIENSVTGMSLKLYRPHMEREQRKLCKILGAPSAGSSDSRLPQGQ
jgi:hypothetical protein